MVVNGSRQINSIIARPRPKFLSPQLFIREKSVRFQGPHTTVMLDETGEVAKLEANQREGIWNMGDFQFHALIATLLVTVALGFCLKVPMLIYLKSSEVSWIN